LTLSLRRYGGRRDERFLKGGADRMMNSETAVTPFGDFLNSFDTRRRRGGLPPGVSPGRKWLFCNGACQLAGYWYNQNASTRNVLLYKFLILTRHTRVLNKIIDEYGLGL
jgi:hypothetical protein